MNGLAIAIIFVLEIWLSDKEPLNGKDDIHLYNNNINIFRHSMVLCHWLEDINSQ